jgi:hypothetical protein
LIEKQDKQARCQARDQCDTAAAAQCANENMMTMVVELICDFWGGGQRRQLKKKPMVKGTRKKGQQINQSKLITERSKKSSKEQHKKDDDKDNKKPPAKLKHKDKGNKEKKRLAEADDGIDLNSDDDNLHKGYH